MKLYLKECKKITASIIFYLFIAILIFSWFQNFRGVTQTEINWANGIPPADIGFERPLLSKPSEKDDYFGSKVSEDNPEAIMTGVTRALLSEYEANSYATYPLGYYKAINQDYRQRWSANTEKTYSVGEIVPIAPDFVGYNLAAEGYMLQVNRFEIVDYRAYTSALQYDGTDRSRIPDKVALVSVTVSQQNSPAEGFPLTELSLYTTDMLMNMDWDLLGVVNPILDGATGIRLQDGASCDILLPFDLYRYRFTSAEWNRLEQSNIWLQVTNYPTRKIVRVNIGEE